MKGSYLDLKGSKGGAVGVPSRDGHQQLVLQRALFLASLRLLLVEKLGEFLAAIAKSMTV